MSYYQSEREHKRNLKELQDNAARRAERRTELTSISQAEQPLNALRLDARPARLCRSTEQYRAVESRAGMLPWNGDRDNLIDRFDGRALLDFYREPVARSQRKSEEELQLEELVAFESYRDLVKLLRRGLSDPEGIAAAQQENIELRAEARTAAAAAAGVPVSNVRPAPSVPAGQGSYGAVGFAYDGGGGGGGEGSLGGSGASSSEDESEPEAELGEQEVDDLAANLGIEGFSSMLRRAQRQEAEIAAGNFQKAKRLYSRKKAAQRARRMAGQGLEAFPKKPIELNADTALAQATRERARAARDAGRRRRSPSYDRYRSDSDSPRRRQAKPKTEYITSFSDLPAKREPAGRVRRASDSDDEPAGPSGRTEGFLDALPSRVDPSTDGGPVSLPASAVVMHGRRAEDRDFPHRYSYARDRDGDRGRDRVRERDRERERSGSRDVRSRREPAAQPKKPEGKETPMERMKRLRAAQLNKTFQKDALTSAQRRAAEERDRAARLQIERANLRRSRSRSRSRSPPRWHSGLAHPRTHSPQHACRPRPPQLLPARPQLPRDDASCTCLAVCMVLVRLVLTGAWRGRVSQVPGPRPLQPLELSGLTS